MVCHAVNLFFEARGESLLGQWWVLDVVTNRVNNPIFPDTICNVVRYPAQFTWYTKHKKDMPLDVSQWNNYILKLYGSNKTEMVSWRRSYAMALDHFYNSVHDLTDGAMWYMTPEALYEWRGGKLFWNTQIVALVGNHIFFNRK